MWILTAFSVDSCTVSMMGKQSVFQDFLILGFCVGFGAFFSPLGAGLCQRERTTLGSQDQGLQQEYTSLCLPYGPGEAECPLMISDHSWSQSIQISFQYGWSKFVPVVYIFLGPQ